MTKAKPFKADITVDRDSFIAFTEGVLLYRTKDACIVGDDTKHKQAEKLLEESGVVLLTVRGKPFSTLRLDTEKDEYVEEKL